MNKILKADMYRYTGKCTGLRNFIKVFFAPGFRYTYFLRKAAKYKMYSPLGFYYRLIVRAYQFKYGYQINPDTVIGEGFYIGHFGFIVVNKFATIGRNCNIAPGVTIGQANRGRLEGYPVIGDYVWMGTNCIIVGKIKIGNNVLIAPGAFVNFDVPDNSMVIGNPGKIIPSGNATEGYITQVLNK